MLLFVSLHLCVSGVYDRRHSVVRVQLLKVQLLRVQRYKGATYSSIIHMHCWISFAPLAIVLLGVVPLAPLAPLKNYNCMQTLKCNVFAKNMASLI